MKYLLLMLPFLSIAHASPLHDAVAAKNHILVNRLVKEGYDINAQLTDEEFQGKSHEFMVVGDTPLILAVRLNLKEIVKLLLEPADLERLQAQFKKDEKKLRNILKNNVLIKIEYESDDDQEQKNPPSEPAKVSQMPILQRQQNSKDLQQCPQLNKQAGLNNLHAFTSEAQEIERSLEAITKAICYRPGELKEIFEKEFDPGNLQKLLLAANADPNIANSAGSIPLFEAVRNYPNNLDITARLLGAGADINAQIAHKTIIEYANEQQKSDMVEHLKRFSIRAQIRITSEKDRKILDGDKPASYIKDFRDGRFTFIMAEMIGLTKNLKNQFCESSFASSVQEQGGRYCGTYLGAAVARRICQGQPGFEESACAKSSPIKVVPNVPFSAYESAREYLTNNASLGKICDFMAERLEEGPNRSELVDKCSALIPDWRERYLSPSVL